VLAGDDVTTPVNTGGGTVLTDLYTDIFFDSYGEQVVIAPPPPIVQDTLSVTSDGPSGIPWTTNPADFPFDVLVAGEQMTVLAITAASNNFLSGNDAGFEGGAGHWVAAGGCTIAQTTARHHTGTGSLAITSTGAGTATTSSCPPADILTEGMAVSPGDQCTCSVWFKAGPSGRYVAAAIDWYDSGGTFLATSIGTALIASPANWQQATATFSAPAGAAFAAADLQVAYTLLDAGLVTYADDVTLTDLTSGGELTQQFTVIRGVNGIVKPHFAGEPVSLAHPAIVALA
jgi:hypothetical protein